MVHVRLASKVSKCPPPGLTVYSDFGDDHPECQVIGTDLSPIQPQWVPPNVML
jgi:hypothetical protein